MVAKVKQEFRVTKCSKISSYRTWNTRSSNGKPSVEATEGNTYSLIWESYEQVSTTSKVCNVQSGGTHKCALKGYCNLWPRNVLMSLLQSAHTLSFVQESSRLRRSAGIPDSPNEAFRGNPQTPHTSITPWPYYSLHPFLSHSSPIAIQKAFYRLTLVKWANNRLITPFTDSSCISKPIPVTIPSKVRVCGLSLTWIAGFESHQGHGCLSLMNVVCCQVEVSATGRSLFQRSPTEYVHVCVRARQWMWSGAIITLYAYNEWVEKFKVRKRLYVKNERNKEYSKCKYKLSWRSVIKRFFRANVKFPVTGPPLP